MALGPRPRVHHPIEADLQVSWRPCAAAKAASSTALPYRTFRPTGYCAEFHSASGFDGQGKRHQVVNLRAKARYAIATLTVQRARSSSFRGLPARLYPSEPFCAHRLLPAFAQAVAPNRPTLRRAACVCQWEAASFPCSMLHAVTIMHDKPPPRCLGTGRHYLTTLTCAQASLSRRLSQSVLAVRCPDRDRWVAACGVGHVRHR